MGARSTHRSVVGCVLCGGVMQYRPAQGGTACIRVWRHGLEGVIVWGTRAASPPPPVVHSLSPCRALSPFTRTAHVRTRGQHTYML
jgi:hypothetical protein